MKKVKGILEGLLYLIVIFLAQKIINNIFSSIVFYLSAQESSLISKMAFSKAMTMEERAVTIIGQLQPVYIMIGWILGICIIALTLKAAKQEILPRFQHKIGLSNILFSVIIGFGMVLLTNGLFYGMLQYFPDTIIKMDTNKFQGNILNILLIVIAIPYLEEVVFRGYIMGRLYQVGSIWFAVFIQGVLFSFSHFDIIQGITVFLLSLGAGYAVIKTNSILSGVIIHSIFNLTNLYLDQNNDFFHDRGQMLVFIAIGLALSYFGMDRLRETENTVL